MAFPKFEKPNIIILMTDQQRAIQHFPDDWVELNLPSLNFLKQHGITFKNAQASTCACSPSRGTLWTGLYPPTNGVYRVPGYLDPTNERNKTNILGNVLSKAGYRVVYKGKWDLTDTNSPETSFDNASKSIPRQTNPPLNPQELQALQYEDNTMLKDWQFEGWLAPDSGTASNRSPGDLNTLGGSFANNDGRYVNGPSFLSSQQTVMEFLSENQNPDQPFCLIVSLVGPHDIWVYPNIYQQNQGKLTSFPDTFKNYQGFELPKSYYDDNLSTKPWAQTNFLNKEGGKLNEEYALNYVKFYAYLHTLADGPNGYFGQILDAISDSLWDNTIVIRLADHGEMGMAHNGLQEKQNTVYQEALNVPLIFSNPKWFNEGIEVDHLVGLVDILPTLATIAGLSKEEKKQFEFQGHDFSQTLLDPEHHTQHHLLFCYDDGVNDETLSPSGAINAIRSIRTKHWKYAVYYASQENDGQVITEKDFQYELYHLKEDPDEITNLLPVGGEVSHHAKKKQKELHEKLTKKMECTKTTPKHWPTTVPS